MYKPGGRVVLNSGGPEMKVVEVVPHVVCEWTDAGGTTRRGTWPAACVRPANSTDAELAERGARTPFADPPADTALPGSDCSTPVTRGEVAGGLPRAEVRLRALIVGAVPMVKEFNRLDEAATGVPSVRAMAWLGAVASERGGVDDGMRTVGVGAAAEVKQLADAPHVVGG